MSHWWQTPTHVAPVAKWHVGASIDMMEGQVWPQEELHVPSKMCRRLSYVGAWTACASNFLELNINLSSQKV
jgi:hypothetical protein